MIPDKSSFPVSKFKPQDEESTFAASQSPAGGELGQTLRGFLDILLPCPWIQILNVCGEDLAR